MQTYPRRGLAALVATVTSTIASRIVGAAGLAKNQIVGTWKMVDATSLDPDGKVLPKPHGPKGMGLVTLNADGRMMAVLCDGRTSLPDGTTRDYASYCGNYTFDGQTLVTKVDASSAARQVCPPGPSRLATTPASTHQTPSIAFEGQLTPSVHRSSLLARSRLR